MCKYHVQFYVPLYLYQVCKLLLRQAEKKTGFLDIVTRFLFVLCCILCQCLYSVRLVQGRQENWVKLCVTVSNKGNFAHICFGGRVSIMRCKSKFSSGLGIHILAVVWRITNLYYITFLRNSDNSLHIFFAFFLISRVKIVTVWGQHLSVMNNIDLIFHSFELGYALVSVTS